MRTSLFPPKICSPCKKCSVPLLPLPSLPCSSKKSLNSRTAASDRISMDLISEMIYVVRNCKKRSSLAACFVVRIVETVLTSTSRSRQTRNSLLSQVVARCIRSVSRCAVEGGEWRLTYRCHFRVLCKLLWSRKGLIPGMDITTNVLYDSFL